MPTQDRDWPAVNTNKIKIITINSCDRASTKPGQMSMLERRGFRRAIGMSGELFRGSAPALFGQCRDGAGENADFAAQFLHALRAALRQILGQARGVALDVAGGAMTSATTAFSLSEDPMAGYRYVLWLTKSSL